MLQTYLPLVIYFTISALVCVGILSVSHLLGRSKHPQKKEKLLPYESGIISTTKVGPRFSIKFYLVAMLFMIFDVEAVSFYPWAVMLHRLRVFGLVEMLLFVIVLGVGYAYVWKRGGFTWDR